MEKAKRFRVSGKHCNAMAHEMGRSDGRWVDYLLLADTTIGRVLLIGGMDTIETYLQLIAGFVKFLGFEEKGARLDKISWDYQELFYERGKKAKGKKEKLLNFRNEIKSILGEMQFRIVSMGGFRNGVNEHSHSLQDFAWIDELGRQAEAEFENY